jgi:hypothetical protein
MTNHDTFIKVSVKKLRLSEVQHVGMSVTVTVAAQSAVAGPSPRFLVSLMV